MNRKIYSSLIFAMLMHFVISAQNVAFVSISLNADGFQWVALEDLPVGTVIKFTDNGIATGGASFESDGEGQSTYTVAGSTLTCGTVVSGPLGTLALSNSGDQVTAYVGTFPSSVTILASISTTAWITTGTTTSTTSYAPASGNGVNPITSNSAVYSGTTSGTSADVQVALVNSGNFTTSSSSSTFTGSFSLTNCAIFGLPIELLAFNSIAINDLIVLSFSTATERDNDYFSIERSSDAVRFEEIGQVKGAGDSNEPKDYTFTDKQPLPGKNYYRLRQVDFDGKFSYSKVVSVNFGSNGGITLSPMPANDQVNVTLDKPGSEDGVWEVLDLSGRIVRTGVFPAEVTEYPVNASDLPDGSYVFRLVMGQEALTKKFWKGN